ncbi:MAG: ThiF family adenylyltransferase [Melioribacteraceae bacterium]|nr:ThiF family adenylyltransferase [Melioribacteraceae bacterium]
MSKYLDIPGESIALEKLTLTQSISLIEAIDLNPFISVVECKKDSVENEILILDTIVEVPQKPRNDIRKTERIAIIVFSNTQTLPDVRALRDDFPLVPHLNLMSSPHPRSLCLYQENYHEMKLKWSAHSFLERIREWLSLTAKGRTHLPDQPLEPLLFANNYILILPDEVLSNRNAKLITAKKVIEGEITTYIVMKEAFSQNDKYSVLPIFGDVQKHGIISAKPNNLNKLNTFLKNANLELIQELRRDLKHWYNTVNPKDVFDFPLIIVVFLPKSREENSKTENFDVYGFISKSTLKEIGVELGIWSIHDGNYALNVPIDESSNGDKLEIEMLNVIPEFTPENASVYNNTIKYENNFALIGLGALGSQVFNNLLREGIGSWILIDHDIVLPHNLSRHILNRDDIGRNKAASMMSYANALYQKDVVKKYSSYNLLEEITLDNSNLSEDLSNSDIILDISASVSVARAITLDCYTNAVRISCFYSPSGQDSVVLAEDVNRNIKLDMIEMVYYREVISNDELAQHLQFDSRIKRYGTSCRDLSTILPFENVVLHGALVTKEIKDFLKTKTSRAIIYKTSSLFDVQRIELPISTETRIKLDEWTLVYDDIFIKKVKALRSNKLPNETGGVLIGSYDRFRKIIYVVDTIPSPSDSHEWPTVYVRGIKGLKKGINEYKSKTNGMLDYIGEWHSHPKGSPPLPSKDDIKAFEWLTITMNESGLISLMLIVSDDYQFYFGKISRD